MIVYKLSEYMKIMRKNRSISQEELAGDICSIHSLSRVENGKSSMRADVYEELMKRLCHRSERIISMTGSRHDMYRIRYLCEWYIARNSIDMAHECYMLLKYELGVHEGESKEAAKYLDCLEKMINYKSGKLSAREYYRFACEIFDFPGSSFEDRTEIAGILGERFMTYAEVALAIELVRAVDELGDANEAIRILRSLMSNIRRFYLRGYMVKMLYMEAYTLIVNLLYNSKSYSEAFAAACKALFLADKDCVFIPELLYLRSLSADNLKAKSSSYGEFTKDIRLAAHMAQMAGNTELSDRIRAHSLLDS